MKPENLAILDLDGKLIEGEINPTNAEIVHMHAIVYKERPDTGAVVHTHSTYATSFALASRSLGCSYEALVRQEMTDGIPLAKYGPRGSAESVSNIADALSATKNTKAVLLENHGVLAFGANPAAAARANLIVEEAAQMAIFAEVLGGAKNIPAGIAQSHRRSQRRIRHARERNERNKCTPAFAQQCRGDRRSPMRENTTINTWKGRKKWNQPQQKNVKP